MLCGMDCSAGAGAVGSKRKDMRDRKYILGSLAFAVVMGLFSVLYAVLSCCHDGDFNWYCVLGSDLLSGTTDLYSPDRYSWIAAERGLSQMQHSWLGSIIVYLISSLFPQIEYGVCCFIFVVAFLFGILLRATYLRELKCRSVLKLIVYALMICLSGSLFCIARTRSFDYILLLPVMYLLQKSTMQARIKPVWFSVIAVLWANLHGSSILMYFLLLAAFVIINAVKDFRCGLVVHQQNKQAARCYFVSLVSAFVAGLANPYGIYLYGYALFENKSYVKEGIAEWGNAALLYSPVLVSLLCFLVYFVILKKTVRLKELFPAVLTLGMTGIHVRMGAYLYIALIPILLNIISEINIRLKDDTDKHKGTLTNIISLILSVLVAVECGVELYQYEYYSVSDELIAYLKRQDFKRTYNDYDLGAYLIYNGLPDFIDARADFFTEDILVPARELSDMSYQDRGTARNFIETFGFDSIILNQRSAAAIDFLLLSGWQIDFEDSREDEGFNYVVLTKCEAQKGTSE